MIRTSLPLNSSASRKSWACRTRPLKVSKPSNSGTFGVEKWPVATMTSSKSSVTIRSLTQVVRGDGELARVLVVMVDHAHRRAEADPVAHARLFDAALDIVPQHCARRIGADRPSEMLLEGVVGEFQAFLRARSTRDSGTCCNGPARHIRRARCARCSSTIRPNRPASRSRRPPECRRPWRRPTGMPEAAPVRTVPLR